MFKGCLRREPSPTPISPKKKFEKQIIMKLKVLPRNRITEKGFIAYRDPTGLRQITAEANERADKMTRDEILAIRASNRNPDGTFKKENNGGVHRGKAKGIREQIKRLQQVCLDTLLEENPEAVIRVQQAIRNLSTNKPEALLQFVSRLLPRETKILEKKAAAPIVIDKFQLNQIQTTPSTTPSPSLQEQQNTQSHFKGSINGKIVAEMEKSPNPSNIVDADPL